MKKILVCNPKHFEVSYEINPWMKNQIGFVDNELAKHQWDVLVDSLSKSSIVSFMEGVQGLPDMVFTANAGLLIDKTFVVSKFATKERQPEEEHFVKWAESQEAINTIIRPEFNFEGEGDCLPDSTGRLWLGHGFRSDTRAVIDLFVACDNDVLSVALVDPRWYHLDTAFCPLKDDTVMWYPGAFDEASQKLIRNTFSKTVDITLDDALKFAANCVVVDDKLFMPHCSTELIKQLNNIGYDVETFDLSEFLKSGGAAKCLTLYLN